jgi:2-octaprenyl-6-methoxyphenol hydroxylase
MIDLVIAGGGYVGLSLAVAVRKARPNLGVTVIDAAPEGAWARDGRASAIAAAAIHMLRALGVWDEIAPEAEPINSMVITDSRTADPVRPVFLTFDGNVAKGEPFAYMVPNPAMVGPLLRMAGALGVRLVPAMRVEGYQAQSRNCAILPASRRCHGITDNPESSPPSNTSAPMAAWPRSISCPRDPSRSCR